MMKALRIRRAFAFFVGMKYTLRDIADKLNLRFHIGNNIQMMNLLFLNDTEMYAFAGNRKGVPQFLKRVKELYLNVDIDNLSEDYSINTKLIWANYYMVRDYHRKTRLYPNFEFRYEKSNEPKMMEYSEKFKILDGFVLPINDTFWNTYLPPNHFGDNCTVCITDKEVTSIPDNLPKVHKRFIVNRHELFFDKSPFNIKEQKIKSTSDKPADYVMGIDVTKLLQEAINDVYGDASIDELEK